MSGDGFAARVVAEARALIGVPFRLHGRSAEMGLDCVGLAALAYRRAGHRGMVPRGYALRTRDVGRIEAWLREAGLRDVEKGEAGDLALVRPGPLHLHLMIRAPGGFVHAHAGLRQVVEMPGDSPWPVIGHWRTMGEK
ncbi:NlpC/P60 family protein [Sphingobium cloacae]|nr:C40 family peptidase [Sphingobium cloacae]